MTAKPCAELSDRFPKFCASLSNGHDRCREGFCWLTPVEEPAEVQQELPL